MVAGYTGVASYRSYKHLGQRLCNFQLRLLITYFDGVDTGEGYTKVAYCWNV